MPTERGEPPRDKEEQTKRNKGKMRIYTEERISRESEDRVLSLSKRLEFLSLSSQECGKGKEKSGHIFIRATNGSDPLRSDGWAAFPPGPLVVIHRPLHRAVQHLMRQDVLVS